MKTGADKLSVAVVGGGIAGLTAAYELAKKGAKVTVYEAEDRLGGLASSIEIDGLAIERYYHFICRGDEQLLDLLEELGLSSRLRWVRTKMGQFYNGRLYPFGEPWDLLFLPEFSLYDRFKFGLGLMSIKNQKDSGWQAIQDTPASQWLIQTFGQKAYEVIYKPLIELKFGRYASRLSAAWMWARIHRLSRSRTRLTQREILGYIEGGTQTLIDELARNISARGGQIFKGASVQRILLEGGKVIGLSLDGEERKHDILISTVPPATFIRLLRNPRGEYFEKIKRIDSIGVVCMLLRLNRPLTRNLWINISDPRIALAGMIEYTNLNPCPSLKGDSLLYLPQYLPSTSDRYRTVGEKLLREYIGYLRMIRPDFNAQWIKEWYVFRDRFAQPICETGFLKYIPCPATSIKGLFMTDSCQLHPDDRTISNSIGLGKRVADLMSQGGMAGNPLLWPEDR